MKPDELLKYRMGDAWEPMGEYLLSKYLETSKKKPYFPYHTLSILRFLSHKGSY